MSPSTLANKIEGTIFPILVTSGQPIVEKEMSLLVSPNLTSSFTDSQCSQITLAKSPCGETMASTMASFVARFRQRLHAGYMRDALSEVSAGHNAVRGDELPFMHSTDSGDGSTRLTISTS